MIILPQLAWIGSLVETRYSDIAAVGDVCAKAVSTAIAKNEYHSALEWFEEGRSIIWRQIMQLRAPVDDLAAVDPVLAAELKQVAHDLDITASRTPINFTTEPSDETSLEHAARRHRHLAEQWERLVNKARQIPGFQGFLRPRLASELVRSAHSGAVVLVNLHQEHCDALVIRPGGAEISCVSLSRFSHSKAAAISIQMSRLVLSRGLNSRGVQPANRSSETSLEETLAVLWKDLVKPILDFLGYTVRSYDIV